MSFVPTLLRIASVALALGCVAFWGMKGAHRGWSQNRVPVKQIDEVTGLEHITYEDRFVPGVEFLGAGFALSAGLLATSFFLSRKTTKQP